MAQGNRGDRGLAHGQERQEWSIGEKREEHQERSVGEKRKEQQKWSVGEKREEHDERTIRAFAQQRNNEWNSREDRVYRKDPTHLRVLQKVGGLTAALF